MVKVNSMRSLLALCIYLVSTPLFAAEPQGAISSQELIKVLGGLLLVILIILFLSWILKRLNASSMLTGSGFKGLASMTLGAREKILLVQAGERYLLLGVTTGSINLLHDFGTEMPAGFHPANPASFSDLMKSVMRKS